MKAHLSSLLPQTQGYFLLCFVASTHVATQEVSSTAPPLPPLLLLLLLVSTSFAHGGNYQQRSVPQSRVASLSFTQPSSPYFLLLLVILNK